MRIAVLEECDPALVKQAVTLHYEALSYRSFITSFGWEFLHRLYVSLLEKRLAFLVTASEGPHLEGFILACVDSSRLMSAVTTRLHRFLPIVVPKLLLHPGLILKTFQTLSYAKKEATDVRAELVVIAVSEAVRSRGLGSALLGALEDAFRDRGIGTYKVTVHQAMERSNSFYARNGMKVTRSFELFGVPWNLYVRAIPPRA
jgi:ribosomal protein S18 acetylase RimI-like enzyme